MLCARCNHENPADALFCQECGVPTEGACSGCGAGNQLSAKFCKKCGQRLAVSATAPSAAAAWRRSPASYTPRHLAEKILASKGALAGEHKLVTVLFCDLVGSTALAERLGPEAMHALLSRFFELALSEVHRYEGTVNQFLGDGFMALFGAPIAHEDHARRAVLAALGLQNAVSQHVPPLVDRAVGQFVVRMGLNTGPVVVGAIGDDLRMDYTAVGDTTNLAARFQQIAVLGTIVAGDTTIRLVRREVVAEALGPRGVRGKRAPVPAYRVMGTRRRSPLGGVEDRTLSPFAGRQRELDTLQDLVDLVEGGQGQIVTIVGEPGVGKSRLLHELAQRLTSRRFAWLEGRCISYGSTIPFLPVLDILRAGCRVLGEDSPATVAAKLGAGLREVGLESAESVPYLLHLLGITEGAESVVQLPADAIKPRTFRILREMSIRGAQHRPIVFVIEDLHWIDRSSEEYLTTLVESLAGAPIFLITTCRPGYRPAWMDRSYSTQVTLRSLSTGESRALARCVGGGGLSEPVAEMILQKAEGNPLFIEELTRIVLERGAVEVPDTIHAVLAARIDRRPPESKAVLQTAAVLGRELPAQYAPALRQ